MSQAESRESSRRHYARKKVRAAAAGMREAWGVGTAVDLDVPKRGVVVEPGELVLHITGTNAARVESVFAPPAHRQRVGGVDEQAVAEQGFAAIWDERDGSVRRLDGVKDLLGAPRVGDVPGTVRSRHGRFVVEDVPVRRWKDRVAVEKVRAEGGLDTTPRTHPFTGEEYTEADAHVQALHTWAGRMQNARAVQVRDEDSGRVVGTMMYDDESHRMFPTMSIHDVRVDPTFRGGGAGTAMMDAVKMRARAAQVPLPDKRVRRRHPVKLKVFGAVASAKSWYATQGGAMVKHSSAGEFDLTPRGVDAPRGSSPWPPFGDSGDSGQDVVVTF